MGFMVRLYPFYKTKSNEILTDSLTLELYSHFAQAQPVTKSSRCFFSSPEPFGISLRRAVVSTESMCAIIKYGYCLPGLNRKL